jgi:nicotinamide-nucleotide adenylyltransferase
MKSSFFIGRFQPFHKGHLDAISQVLKKNDKVIIGLGSSQTKNTAKNPLDAIKRKRIISSVLDEHGIKNYEIYLIPDFEKDEDWIRYIKDNIPNFDHAYSGNDYVLGIMKGAGFKTKRIKFNLDISGTMIREMISKENKRWKNLVDKKVTEEIDENKIRRIIKKSS